MRRILINTLKRLGYSAVTEAGSGREAIKKVKAQAFDLIITDWNMPDIDGLQLAEILKSSKDFENIPVIMASSRSVQEDIVTAIKAGVNGYIVKPFTPEILKAKIEQVLEGI
jgi:two-component system chemotaxis response regulator CheY